MEHFSRTWLILASLPRSWLPFARSCMALAASLPRSWQDLGKASNEIGIDLGNDTMASNTGCFFGNCEKCFFQHFSAKNKTRLGPDLIFSKVC